MTNQDVAQQVQEAWNMSEEDLYKRLGLASLGTSSLVESASSMKMLMSTAAHTDATYATRFLSDTLLEKGQDYFERLWDGGKGVVCTIYSDKTTIGDAKDLAAYIIGIVVAAGKIANPLAVLVITIAVKMGLDKLCNIKA